MGSGGNRRYELTWTDNSKNETAFVIERSSSPDGPRSTLATVPSDRLIDGPGTGTRTYTDRGVRGNIYYYQVYAINVVGDTWDYSDPNLNQIAPGGGWPTLTLDSRGNDLSTIAAPSNLLAGSVSKNKKTATVTLNWTDNSAIETGFLIQRSESPTFLGAVNATVPGDVTTFSQTVSRGRTYYYRVLAFNDTTQSGWSDTASVATP